MNKEEILEIGKYLEYRRFVRNEVDKTGKWSKDEKYLVNLYDSFLNLKIKYNKQQQVINQLQEWLDEMLLVREYDRCDGKETLEDVKQKLNDLIKEID